jgi:3-oxosteroid 1-dehydrogenase
MAWDHEIDLLVVGSGAAGMAAAVRGHDLGMKVLIVEASEFYGGSTAISGGVVWVPNNDQLPGRGIQDTPDAARTYLREITKGEVAPERIDAYVEHAPRMQTWMAENTWLELDSLEKYTDYYPESPGGLPGGRSMEPVIFDATVLGDEFARLRRPHPQSQVMGKFGISARQAQGFLAPTNKDRLLLLWLFILWFFRGFKRRNQPRDTRLHAGNALIARLRRSLMDRDVPLWLEAPCTELVIEDRVVVGAVVDKAGTPMRVRARRGVLLGAGGFEQNQAWRDEHHSLGESKVEWNTGNPRNQGDGIRMGMDAGGAITNMHEAWWTPVTRVPRSDPAWVLVVEKSLPGSLFVNGAAQRFTNESAPYEDVVKGMYSGGAVPVCWMIFDAECRRLYPIGPTAPGYAQPDQRLSRRLREGFFTKAKTLEELAEKLELDSEALAGTIARYNELCRSGVDTDFGRGDSASDRYYGDRRIEPNPCLRALTNSPYYAIPIFPGELGTKGGLVTDPSARVLREDGSAIPGLFAAGNTSAAVMGPSYPGAGGTIGPALTFGMLAAEAAAATD